MHTSREAGSIILRVGYGYVTEPHARDPLVDLVDKAMEDFSQLVLPGAWLVNFIPMCMRPRLYAKMYADKL